jgi:glycosyltransferase involved in cell wall biosynthesis
VTQLETHRETHRATRRASERIAIVAPSVEAAAVLRGDLIEDLVGRGHRILCLTPPGPGKYTLRLRRLGAQHRVVEEPQPRLQLLTDWQAIMGLVTQFQDWQPNVVLGFGLRTLMLSALAGKRARVRRIVSLLNGLPSDGIESVSRRRFAHALRASDAVVFHNRDNARYISRLGLLPANMPSVVVPGSGIDLTNYAAVPLPPQDEGLAFLMLGRLERRRGVLEYAAAARALKARWPAAKFRFAGATSAEPDAVSAEILTQGGAVEYLGHLDDVRAALAACHVFVYPSYAEGMPRAVLEAMATGRPIVTTQAPGCSETVDEMVSGCLVPPADAAALAAAMECYLRRPELIAIGARAARLKAERRFDANDVNAAFARVLGLA